MLSEPRNLGRHKDDYGLGDWGGHSDEDKHVSMQSKCSELGSGEGADI